MKTADGFKLRTVMGKPIIVAEGLKQVNFNKVISLNSSAELLWKAIEGKDFNVDDLAKILVDKYGISLEQAMSDSSDIAADWKKHGLVVD